ncbi:MAG: LptF/LptG family permease [Bacteroidetes bacterium]|nr:LptF/LptG family permease [Bacteroidota bacterium]MBS1649347.1 LptF/LptG family permease [Bacteroidota bacterium]
MIKKLDILVLRAFIGPFFATFLISIFVLVLQFFWVYLDDFVGKGLDTGTLFYLIGMVAIHWVPLALPLALLLSSIMTFGNLGETFEIVAIKAAGIPLLRFMRPLFITSVFISGIAFLFANNIIPYAELKLDTLKYDIIISKPAFDIKEGVFYNKIDGYIIKIGKKEKDDSTIRNIVIYEKNYNLQDNLLVAESGIMRTTPDKKFLEFVMHNGWRYQEKGPHQTFATDYIKTHFKEYKKVFDLKSFQLNKTNDSSLYNPKILSVRQLQKAVDSIKNNDSIYIKRATIEINPYLTFTKYKDSVWPKHIDTTYSYPKSLADSISLLVFERVANQINLVKANANILNNDYLMKQQSLRNHEIEWHRKFTLSFACLVLFLIGAPLGSIIRKGGLGSPLVFAIVFFVLFHLLNTFGEKFAKEGVTSVFVGMWLSTLVLIPVGIFLIYKAMRDSQLFNQEFYFRLFRSIKTIIGNFTNRK